MSRLRHADVEVGTELPERTFPVRRLDLVRYAGASGDFNPIHWNPEFAQMVGLPGVIAHGMFNMGLVARVVSEWVGDPAAVKRLSVQFRKEVLPDEKGPTCAEFLTRAAAWFAAS